MDSNVLFALAVFALVSSITPGPNNVMLLASGINFGFARTIPHALGVGLGFMFMIVLVGLGLMGVFDAYPVSYMVLKTLSVIYLLYLAWKIATAAPPTDTDASTGKPFTFLQAAAFQWVNPKAWSMALTAITVYTPPDHPLWSILIVSLVFGALNLPSVSVWVLMGTQLRRLLRDPLKLRIFNVVASILLVATLIPILI